MDATAMGDIMEIVVRKTCVELERKI